jgi:hypothetical protein
LASHRDGAGHHACAAGLAGIAPDQDHASPHAVAGARSDIAGDAHKTAPHAQPFPGFGSAEECPGVAADDQNPARPAGRRLVTDRAGDPDFAAALAGSNLITGIAFNEDLTFSEISADAVKAFARALESNPRTWLTFELKDLS